LIEKSAAEAAKLDQREAQFLGLAQQWIREAATPAYEGDYISPEMQSTGALDVLLAQQGIYFRAAQPDIDQPGMTESIRGARKDALLLCLVQPPPSTEDADLTVAATRWPAGGEKFEQATRSVQRLEAVQRGLRALSPSWADEVRAANPMALDALAGEFESRTPEQLEVAKGWARSDFVVVAIDELPADMKTPDDSSALARSFRTSMLPAVQSKTHAVRLAIYHVKSQKLALRLRQSVDAPAFAARTGLSDAHLAEDCRVGAMARIVTADTRKAEFEPR
jgi:hypothetical protein